MPDLRQTHSHLNQNTPLASAIKSWEAYLADQGRSPNTIKAFFSNSVNDYLPLVKCQVLFWEETYLDTYEVKFFYFFFNLGFVSATRFFGSRGA